MKIYSPLVPKSPPDDREAAQLRVELPLSTTIKVTLHAAMGPFKGKAQVQRNEVHNRGKLASAPTYTLNYRPFIRLKQDSGVELDVCRAMI